MTARAMIHQNDRSLAMLAHLSGLAGYLSFGLGFLIPLVMWITLSERPELARIAKQALFLNIAVVIAGVAAFLMIFTVVLIPVSWAIGILATPVAIALPIVGAIKAHHGEWFRYPVVGMFV